MTTEDINVYKNMFSKCRDNLQAEYVKWTSLLSQRADLPENAANMINSTCGKAQLLLNGKFEQFDTFLNDVEVGNVGNVVLSGDIQGFWETILIQVEELERLFLHLEKLQERDFCEEVFAEAETTCLKTPSRKSIPHRTSPKTTTASKDLREFIAAQRGKNKNSSFAELPTSVIIEASGSKPVGMQVSDDEKTARPTVVQLANSRSDAAAKISLQESTDQKTQSTSIEPTTTVSSPSNRTSVEVSVIKRGPLASPEITCKQTSVIVKVNQTVASVQGSTNSVIKLLSSSDNRLIKKNSDDNRESHHLLTPDTTANGKFEMAVEEKMSAEMKVSVIQSKTLSSSPNSTDK